MSKTDGKVMQHDEIGLGQWLELGWRIWVDGTWTLGWKLAMKLDAFKTPGETLGSLGYSLWISNINIRNEPMMEAKLGRNGMFCGNIIKIYIAL